VRGKLKRRLALPGTYRDGATYFAAFAYDPDGHNVEAVVDGVG
jgi:hypothetical protein